MCAHVTESVKEVKRERHHLQHFLTALHLLILLYNLDTINLSVPASAQLTPEF